MSTPLTEMTPEQSAPVALLPFPFANRHQFILTEENGMPLLLSHGLPRPDIFAEVRRFAGRFPHLQTS